MRKLLVKALENKGLYHPNDVNANQLVVVINRETDSYSDKSIQSYVEILNDNGDIEMFVVYIMNGKGLRTLDYVKERFAEILVNYLQLPVKN